MSDLVINVFSTPNGERLPLTS